MRGWIRVAVISVLVLQAGCAGISRDRYSKPSAERWDANSIKEPYVGDMYVVGDVAFDIFPLNATGTDVLIFPIPLRFSEPAEKPTPFLMGVAFKARTEGYTFRPSSIQYWSDPTRRLSPSHIQGPFDCGSTNSRPPTVPITVAEIRIPAQSCIYLWVTFDAVTPDPAQIFYASLTVRLGEKDIVLPEIKFREARRTRSFALP